MLNYTDKTVTGLSQIKGVLVIFWTALTVKSEPTFPTRQLCEPSINSLQHTGKHPFNVIICDVIYLPVNSKSFFKIIVFHNSVPVQACMNEFLKFHCPLISYATVNNTYFAFCELNFICNTFMHYQSYIIVCDKNRQIMTKFR